MDTGRKSDRERESYPELDFDDYMQPPERRAGGAFRAPRGRRRSVLVLPLAVLLLVLGAVFVVRNIMVSRVKGFEVASATADRQVLSWESVGGADSYDIYDNRGELLAELDARGDTQYAVDGLQSGTRYTYTIVAVKNFLGKHFGEAMGCSAYTKPETVRAVTATNAETGALLRWEGSGMNGYEVQYTDESGAVKLMETQSIGADGMSIPDLKAGVQYTFQVRSFVQDGESRIYSDWVSAEPLIAAHAQDLTGIDLTKPMVALTFDDGPDYDGITGRILDTLKKYGGHASFFQLGDRAAELPEVMERIAAEGHEIACHTYDHKHMGSDVTEYDIVHGDDVIEQASGKRPSAFRSPGGDTTELIRQTCMYEGMPIFYWSIDTQDWRSKNADAVYNAVMNNVSDGDIVLMHNIYSSTADAIERIVPELVEQGYQLVTVSQLVQAKTGEPPIPGTQYISATVTN